MQVFSFTGSTISATPYTMSAYAYRTCQTGISVTGRLISASLFTLSASAVSASTLLVELEKDGSSFYDVTVPLVNGEGEKQRELRPSGYVSGGEVSPGDIFAVRFTSLRPGQSVMNPTLTIQVASTDAEFDTIRYM